MAVQTEKQYAGDWLKYEEENLYSRQKVTIAGGIGTARALTSGMVLGRTNTGAATVVATAGNTGNGTIGTVTVSGAKVGAYRLTCMAVAVNAGKFSVEDPEGKQVGVATVAVAFTGGGLTFTIADGATDFVAGDSFTINVADGFKYVQFDDTATNGAQNAAGILLGSGTAPVGVGTPATVIARGPAVVSANGITWPATADAAEKAAATLQLNALGIQVREGA